MNELKWMFTYPDEAAFVGTPSREQPAERRPETDILRVHATDPRLSRMNTFLQIVQGYRAPDSSRLTDCQQLPDTDSLDIPYVDVLVQFMHSIACRHKQYGKDLAAFFLTFGWDPKFIDPTRRLYRPPSRYDEAPGTAGVVTMTVSHAYHRAYSAAYSASKLKAQEHPDEQSVLQNEEFFVEFFVNAHLHEMSASMLPQKHIVVHQAATAMFNLNLRFSPYAIKQNAASAIPEDGDIPNWFVHTTRTAQQFIKLAPNIQWSAAGYAAAYLATVRVENNREEVPGAFLPDQKNTHYGSDMLYDCGMCFRIARKCGYARGSETAPSQRSTCILAVGGEGLRVFPTCAHWSGVGAQCFQGPDGKLSQGHMSAVLKFLHALGLLASAGRGGVAADGVSAGVVAGHTDAVTMTDTEAAPAYAPNVPNEWRILS